VPDDIEPHSEPMPVDADAARQSPVGGFRKTGLLSAVGRLEHPAITALIRDTQAAVFGPAWTNRPLLNLIDTAKFLQPFTTNLVQRFTVDIGKVALETSGYARSFEAIRSMVAASSAPLWAQFAPALELFKWHWLPANLREIDDLSIEALVSVADDGITLYAVPRAAIARRILAATDKAARRRILGRELPRILDDCDAVLDRCIAPTARSAVVFARKAIAAARDGHIEAAQALVANTLDTAMKSGFEKDDRILFTSHKRPDARDALDELAVRKFMVVVPIWHAYSTFTPGQADPVPWTFNRHVNSHAVNARQFNRPNMAQGIMLLTGLIALLNDL
jgi:hypothetical protein